MTVLMLSSISLWEMLWYMGFCLVVILWSVARLVVYTRRALIHLLDWVVFPLGMNLWLVNDGPIPVQHRYFTFFLAMFILGLTLD